MSKYRRAYHNGGCYFFTVVTYNRRKILLQPDENLQRLKAAFQHIMKNHPFEIDAAVILPDHLHCIWTLPENDHDFSIRWRLIKHFFSTGINFTKTDRNEKTVWQKRFWEHLIRDENDWRRHMDYIHYNPVRHSYVKRPADWQHGSFLRAVKNGLYQKRWGESLPETIKNTDLE